MHGNKIFSVNIYKRYKYDITLLPKKQNLIFSQKCTTKSEISGITKKILFILENMVFLVKYSID